MLQHKNRPKKFISSKIHQELAKNPLGAQNQAKRMISRGENFKFCNFKVIMSQISMETVKIRSSQWSLGQLLLKLTIRGKTIDHICLKLPLNRPGGTDSAPSPGFS